METARIFIGYDPREAAAFHVCAQSIIEHSSMPVAIHPLALNLLKDYEEGHTDGSNAFIYSRFLVPHLCGFSGHALFLDGDMLVRGDISDLWNLRRLDRGVQVVKHDYKTKYPTKYLGSVNEDYPRKNWSSVVLWNCAYFPNHGLRPEFVMKATGDYLHRFAWLKDEQIGDLPAGWNHLCMESDPDPVAAIYHYTVGTPCFGGKYAKQEGADEWFATKQRAMAPG